MSKGMAVLTPFGTGRVTNLDNMRDLVAIRLDDKLSSGEVALIELNLPAFQTPLLRHFPDDNPVEQYELWAATNAVVEVCTLRAQITCDCGCKHCSMKPTAAWVLGGYPSWQGSVHDTTNGCQCLTKNVCRCTQVDLPSISREAFMRLVTGASVEVKIPWRP